MQLKCMNFYGLETERDGLVCDWVNPPRYYLEHLKVDLAIDTIRLPFSHQYIRSQNLSNMDRFMFDTFDLGLHVILDYHRTWSSHQGPIPEENITFDEFLDTWLILLDRYVNFTNILGLGVFNEIQTNDTDYVNTMHEKFIKTIENKYPGRFYYFCGCIGWGGNCSTIQLDHLPEWERIFIEVHKYRFSGSQTVHDWDVSIPSRIPADHWFVGEVGWRQNQQEEKEWAETFLAYLKKRNILSVCAWTIAHSGDTDGWWKDDCTTFDYEKAALLKTLWFGEFKRLRGLT